MRNAAQRLPQETGFVADWDQYKYLRNSVNSALKNEKIVWQRKMLEEAPADSRSTWQNVKEWIRWKSVGPPTKLIDGGEIFSKPSKLADIMNHFLVNKVKRLRDNLPPASKIHVGLRLPT